jgi:hypothetical protein
LAVNNAARHACNRLPVIRFVSVTLTQGSRGCLTHRPLPSLTKVLQQWNEHGRGAALGIQTLNKKVPHYSR